MKKVTKLISVIGFSLCLSACQGTREVSYEQLRGGFTNLPDSIQTSVYWHWISGNISKEGVIKDLESMKQAGINRAFIANIGLSAAEAPTGDVQIFSDEWWEILHAALKKATELNIEIGIFNSPGWSQAGGPWIKPEQSMRYLASVGTQVKGGQAIEVMLPKTNPNFQDVKVLAYPSVKSKATILNPANCTVSSSPAITAIHHLIDGETATEIRFGNQSEVVIDFKSHDTVALRSLRLLTSTAPIRCQAVLQMNDNGEYKEIKQFSIERYNDNLAVGFDPYAPIAISFPTASGKDFRLSLSGLNPNSGIREITLSSAPVVESYSEKTFAKMYQTPLPYWNEYQWPVQAVVDDPALIVQPGQVKDITACMKGDKLSWNAPDGEWEIVRMGMVPTYVENGPALKDGIGLEVDKMSKEHLRSHFDAFIGEIYKRIPEADRKTWKVVVADSYEKGGQNFTDDFLESFEKKYGYSALPFLPVYNGVVVESEDASDRFLWDMRKMVAERLSYDHIGELTRLSHQYGMTTWLENYGHWGFSGEFLQYGGQADEVAGEFWSEGELGNIENRAASSCGHIYGKQKISSESFTCGGMAYSRYPATMKQRGDLFFSEGINNTLLHVYISQKAEGKLPGLNAPYSNEFNRFNTWYSQLDLFTDYLKRCNFMLQQGLNVADICYFIGEDTPKMTGVTNPPLPKGYQFDYINAEVILRDMTVKDGLLTLPHGTSYRIMVLPELETMRPELLTKITQLVKDGGVILGPKPNRSPSLQDFPEADKKVQEMANALWGNVDGIKVKSGNYGNGMILSGMNMHEALELVHCIPDCALTKDIPVVYGHRSIGDMDVYFLSNQSSEKVVFSPEFRVTNKQPELWEPATGVIRLLKKYERNANATVVPLELEPLESIFVVFAKEASSSSLVNDTDTNYPKPQTIATLAGPWTVSFDKSQRGPQDPVVFQSLYDWSTSKEDAIRYYSGTAVYRTEFTLKDIVPNSPLFINLNEVAVMAKVKVNGQYIGGVWTAPYRLNISEAIKQGTNKVEIEVVNTWVNRLIGDSKLPVEERPTWTPNNPWNPSSPLQKSGLIGPVVIESITY